MKRAGRVLDGLRRKLLYGREYIPSGGIPYVLGQGLDSPCVQPGLRVYWHPPFSAMDAAEPAPKKSGIGVLIGRLGFRRKSA